ncbi:MAG TPA: hypothetical protein VJS89_06150 [Gammaproteobacteria bacterium]|nr:hypothetical protein [Gammaproteobacteria bacterium]
MKLFIALCCCALMCPLSALAADNFNYNYAELGYQRQVTPGGPTFKGPALDFSWTAYNELQVIGSYDRFTVSSPDISDSNYSIGIRGDSSFSEQTDFTTDILYVDNRATMSGSSSTDNGYRLAFGFRHLFNQWLELDGSIGHDWLTRSSNDVGLGLLFNATTRLAAGLSYSHNSVTGNTASANVRFYF